MPAPFTDLIGTDSFTESLRQENLATWLSATNHRFVAELFDGSIAPQVMAGYLVQDYRFLDTFLALIGGAIANADTLAGRLRLSKFAGEIAGDENTYFLRCFETLGGGDHRLQAPLPRRCGKRQLRGDSVGADGLRGPVPGLGV